MPPSIRIAVTAVFLFALLPVACGGMIEPPTESEADARPSGDAADVSPPGLPKFCTPGGDECQNGAVCCDEGEAFVCRFECPSPGQIR